jgi:hypothetical protein
MPLIQTEHHTGHKCLLNNKIVQLNKIKQSPKLIFSLGDCYVYKY